MTLRTLTVLLAFAALSAGCVSVPGSDIGTTGTDAADAAAAMPTTDVLEGDILASTATPARSFNNGGAFNLPLPRASNASGYVIEVEWSAALPTNEQLSVWIRDSASGNPMDPASVIGGADAIAKVTGTSPLRIALTAEDFPDDADYSILVRAAEPAGVAVNQPFTVHLTTFKDMPFDADYSALGEGHGHE